jgi:hypothetical protein
MFLLVIVDAAIGPVSRGPPHRHIARIRLFFPGRARSVLQTAPGRQMGSPWPRRPGCRCRSGESRQLIDPQAKSPQPQRKGRLIEEPVRAATPAGGDRLRLRFRGDFQRSAARSACSSSTSTAASVACWSTPKTSAPPRRRPPRSSTLRARTARSQTPTPS